MNAKAPNIAKANVTGFKPLFHPAAHYASASAVLDDAEVPVPLEEAIANMAVIEAIFRSAETGSWEQPKR